MATTAATRAPSAPRIGILTKSPRWNDEPGAQELLHRALAAAAAATNVADGAEVSLMLADDATIRALNARWRGRDEATNVLSFPAAASSRGAGLLGDIVIAHEITAREAASEGKPMADHLAHLAVHGFLHLLGYDHLTDADAEAMESLERVILARIGIPDPYRARKAQT